MKKFAVITAALSLSVIFSSCSKKSEKTVDSLPSKPEKFSWFYFADDNFRKTGNIQDIPSAPLTPWTESVRISDASVQDSGSSSIPKGFALVNRIGILSFSDGEAELSAERTIFSKTTAGNLVFYNNEPYFSVYKSSFFNSANNIRPADSRQHLFLAKFNPEQKICYPVLSIGNLGVSESSEVTDFIYDGHYITCCIKDSGNNSEKIDFYYLTLQTKAPLDSITPVNASSQLFITQTDSTNFRKEKEIQAFSKAPARIKKLYSSIPDNLSYTVKVRTAGGHSPRTYINHDNGETPLESNALLCDSWCACLFGDGTFFLNGALYENRILSHGKNIGLKLPKLPEGFKYTYFCISGTWLYAAWEESSFYSCGRSGFISVNLNEILYKTEFSR